jgi:hypothetical protein
MSKFVYPITNFGSGELSEDLFGRVDVREYASGLSYTDNALLSPRGGVYKRIGSKLKGRVGSNIIDGQVYDTEEVNILSFILDDG